ncbi:MAG: chromosomal replication initiator protein DnaA, partial [Actinomycetota bacterium]|nr:chromosomal replication initiator protein DnaA [Actinomycetota bacterium]
MRTTSFDGPSTTTEHPVDAPPSDAESIWSAAGAALRDHLGEGSFSLAFGRTRASSLQATTLRLAVPNPFVKEWIEGRYLDILREAVSDVAGRPLEVVIAIDETAVGDDEELTRGLAHDGTVLDAVPAAAEDGQAAFHPKYTFDSFVIGSSNRFAHAAALAVAEAPAEAYNPLFIYGAAGLGKTHLLHAVGHYVQQFHPRMSVRYVSTEQFMNDFIAALQHRTIPAFHQRYRRADVVLIDDIQFLEGKERTQEEFFHTFNALYPKSQLVISSDRVPKKIATLEERLRTRFEWGLITDIQPPDLETRLAILQKKAEAKSLPAPPEVLSFIASRIQTNIRELEGALIRVGAYASLTRSEMSLDLAQNVLHSLLPNAHETRITADLVIA